MGFILKFLLIGAALKIGKLYLLHSFTQRNNNGHSSSSVDFNAPSISDDETTHSTPDHIDLITTKVDTSQRAFEGVRLMVVTTNGTDESLCFYDNNIDTCQTYVSALRPSFNDVLLHIYGTKSLNLPGAEGGSCKCSQDQTGTYIKSVEYETERFKSNRPKNRKRQAEPQYRDGYNYPKPVVASLSILNLRNMTEQTNSENSEGPSTSSGESTEKSPPDNGSSTSTEDNTETVKEVTKTSSTVGDSKVLPQATEGSMLDILQSSASEIVVDSVRSALKCSCSNTK